MSVRWFVKGKEIFHPDKTRPPESWDRMLETGLNKVQESDRPYGPFTDTRMDDDGSVHQEKRYVALRSKEADGPPVPLGRSPNYGPRHGLKRR